MPGTAAEEAAPLRRRRAWVVLLAALLVVALTARLGVWQLSRAAQKRALQDSLDERAHLPPLPAEALARTVEDAAGQHDRHIHLQGEWVAAATVFLDNRQMNGRPGFFVVTPLRLPGGDTVLVQRGWAPREMGDRTHVPAVLSPAGPVDVDGRIAPPPGRLYDFAGGEPRGTIRQNLDLAAFAAEWKLLLRPVSVLQADMPSTADDGLLRQWAPPAVDIQKHYGYAFQWFALCALTTGLYVWFQLVRPRFQRRRDPSLPR
jgi:surfeit locus 1 family protein